MDLLRLQEDERDEVLALGGDGPRGLLARQRIEGDTGEAGCRGRVNALAQRGLLCGPRDFGDRHETSLTAGARERSGIAVAAKRHEHRAKAGLAQQGNRPRVEDAPPREHVLVGIDIRRDWRNRQQH